MDYFVEAGFEHPDIKLVLGTYITSIELRTTVADGSTDIPQQTPV